MSEEGHSTPIDSEHDTASQHLDAVTQAGPIDLSIVLVNWNAHKLIADCLKSLSTSGTRLRYEIIISDNASTDGSVEWLHQLARQQPCVRLVLGTTNAGFGVGNNRALPFCQGRYVLFLNTDTIILEPLDALVAAADALGERCGALGGRVLNADRTIQPTCRGPYTMAIIAAGFTSAFLGWRSAAARAQEFADWDHATPREVATLSGCYLLVPRAVLRVVGGFDPRIFLFYEDTDLCYRIRQAGYTVHYVPVSAIVHLEGGASRATGINPRVLGHNLASALYFTRTYLGGPAAEQRLARIVRRRWRLMWLALAPAAALMPLPGPRATLRRRAHLLGTLLARFEELRI